MWESVQSSQQSKSTSSVHYLLLPKYVNVYDICTFLSISAFLPTALLLIGVGYIGCSSEAAVAVLAIASGLIGSCNSGPCINDMDIAPTFAGLLSGITNTGGTIAGIFAPMVVGVITENEVCYYDTVIGFPSAPFEVVVYS